MKFLNFKKVLCISPHPDDVEYSMSGTIMKHVKTKFDILCLSIGGDFDDTNEQQRQKEIQNCWALSKSKNVNLHFSPHTFIKSIGTDQWINYIETEFVNKNTYDCICVTASSDSHFEHEYVSKFGHPLVRIKPISLIEYCSPSTLETWIPNIFVNITDVYDDKLKMLEEFKSQKNRLYFKKEVIDGFHVSFSHFKRGLVKIEKFKLLQHLS